MAISFIGAGAANGGTGDTTYSFASLLNSAGITPTLLSGDIVIVASCRRHTANLAQTTPAGYSVLVPNVYSNGATQDTNLIVFYKFMGTTPDTSFTMPASGVAAGGSSFTVHVFRGVQTLDTGSPQTASGVGATATDPPSVTPVTAGAVIYVAGGACASTAHTLMTAPANITGAGANSFQSQDPSQANCAAGVHAGWVSGAFNPAAFGGGNTGAAGSWAAISLALKPAATGGNMKVWNGSAWVEKPAKVWNGSAWVAKPVKVWNGSAWVLS